MKFLNNHRHQLFFIGGSLLLLAVLEGFWLKKLYDDEREHLRHDIEQYVLVNASAMQITLMQKNNVRLIDSFLSEKEGNEQRMKAMFMGAYDKNGKLLGINDFIDKERDIFFKKLDTIGLLNFGVDRDSVEINGFLERTRNDYRKYNINQKPRNSRDSVKYIHEFIENQKKYYTSLWYIYRIIEHNPNVNRAVMDSFFNAQREYHDWADRNLWHIQAKSMKYDNTGSYTTPRFTIKNGKKSIDFMDTKRINIVFSDTVKTKKGGRDSFLSNNAYQFQRFVGSMIKPEELKTKLKDKFPELTFNVSRIDSDSLVEWNLNKGIVTTFPAGSRIKIDEYGISNKDQKLSVVSYGFQPFIFKKIYPEVLFALLVLVITALSFWLIYRNVLEQKRLINLKNDFISNITHELKTPIATVGVAIEAMNSFNALDNPARTKEYLDISKSELNRLTLLVDKVLKMAVFEQGDPQLNVETFDLAELTQGILNSMKLQFERYHATVTFSPPAPQREELESNNSPLWGAGGLVNADKTHITSVIYNLIDNALKYGGEKPDINIAIQAPFYGFVHLSVSDNGAGIPPQYKDKIFEKFFRIPTGDVHNTKGHGLGLSYVMSVIGQHKGKINVESEEGKGSTFSIFLPL